MYLNEVMLMGALARAPEQRQSDNGFPVTHAAVVLEEQNDSGKVFKTFVPLTGWGSAAKTLAGLSQGATVLIKGRLRYRSWKDAQGQKQGRLEVHTFQLQSVPVQPVTPATAATN